ncbi:MAG: DUF805 domain-containing protein [Chloroflexi bacterium]|nr:DUF805 domain-containing protein [Chloroflexota bacterium]
MNFQKAVAAYYANYANFSGRTSRPGYWWVVLWGIITGGLAAAVGTLGALGITLYVIYLVAHIIPGLAIAVRRLHDSGKSGWFLLITFIPLIGGIIILIFMLQGSERGTNNWGVPQLSEKAAS